MRVALPQALLVSGTTLSDTLIVWIIRASGRVGSRALFGCRVRKSDSVTNTRTQACAPLPNQCKDFGTLAWAFAEAGGLVENRRLGESVPAMPQRCL
jgi:hypothetical protein